MFWIELGVTDLTLSSQLDPRGRARQARSKARISAILDAVREIVQKDGIDAVTTTAVAKLAKVPVGSIYQYFSDRDDLLNALRLELHGRAMTSVLERAARIDAAKDWRRASEELIDAFWLGARATPALFALTRWAMQALPMKLVISEKGSTEARVVDAFFAASGARLPQERAAEVKQTCLVLIQALTDAALSEPDTMAADRLRGETVAVLHAYLTPFFNVN